MTPRALVVRGGWDGHEPVAAVERFLPFLASCGYDVTLSESPEDYADVELMARTDLVLQCVTMAEASDAAIRGLIASVTAGTGLAGWHGGIADSFRSHASYLQLVGGQFAAHPSRPPEQRRRDPSDNYLRYRVELTALGREHAITAGLEEFELETEQYWVLHDDLNDVLATTTHPVAPHHPWHRPITSPVVWTREWGAGRVFVATPGHRAEVLDHPAVRTVVERGLLWATRTA